MTLLAVAATAFGSISWAILYMGYAHPESYQKNVFKMLFRFGMFLLFMLLAAVFGITISALYVQPYVMPEHIGKMDELKQNTILIGGVAFLWISGFTIISLMATRLKDWGIVKDQSPKE